MKDIALGKHKVTLYCNIKELPIRLYNQMQSLLLQEAGIGSTMQDVDKHFSNLDAYLLAGKIEEARIERTNLQLAFYSCLEKINYKSLAFSYLIKSIDNIDVVDYSEEGLKVLIDKLSDMGLTQYLVEEQLEDIKKNCILN